MIADYYNREYGLECYADEGIIRIIADNGWSVPLDVAEAFAKGILESVKKVNDYNRKQAPSR